MNGARRSKRLALQALAFGQAGYFTAAQTVDLGYSYQAQKYHVDNGNWLRIDRGLFQLPDWLASPDDQWVRWTLWSRGRGVVSHDSAALVHDLGELDPTHVHLSVPHGYRALDPTVVTHMADLPSTDVLDRGSWRVTTPLRTLLDLASGSTTQEQLESAVASALDQGLTTLRRIRSRADEPGDRAALRLERALGAAQSRTDHLRGILRRVVGSPGVGARHCSRDVAGGEIRALCREADEAGPPIGRRDLDQADERRRSGARHDQDAVRQRQIGVSRRREGSGDRLRPD